MTDDFEIGDEAIRLLAAVLGLLQRANEWPTFDDLDTYADRKLGIPDADRVLLGLPSELVVGLGYMSAIPGDQPIRLTVRAIAACEQGAELAGAFVRAVVVAAELEETRIVGAPPPVLTPDDLAPWLPAAGRQDLLRQVGKLLAVERWGWTLAGTDYPWSFTIGRDVRRFRGIESLAAYLLKSAWPTPVIHGGPRSSAAAGPSNEPVEASSPSTSAVNANATAALDHQPPTDATSDARGQAPTAFITWSHGEPGWSDDEREQRRDVVLSIANWLRSNGIDADVDIYHHQQGIDWSRWGPRRIGEVDYVLIAASAAWARAWEGTGDPTIGGGAAAEADALKTMYERDRSEFVGRVRLVVPPGESVVPAALPGTRYRVAAVPDDGLIDLLRDLTRQPRHPKAELGTIPVLEPMPHETDASQFVRIGQRRHVTDSGEIIVASPEISRVPGASAIQRQVDVLVNEELARFDANEEFRRQLAPPANLATIRWIPTLVSHGILSFLVDADLVEPGRAPSSQRTSGLVFEAASGRRLSEIDVFVDDTAWRPALIERFLERAAAIAGGSTTATALPDPLTFALTRDQFGIATCRYDIGPGVLGAPTVWIDHDDIDRHYRNEFLRLLRMA